MPDINNENSEKPLPKFEGSEELQTKLKTLYSAYEDIFSIRLKEEPAKIKPFKLEVDDLQWQVPKNNTAPRPQSIPNQLEIQTQIKELLAKGVITESQELYNSQVHLVPKPNGKKRFTIDFRNLNHVSKSMGWPLPVSSVGLTGMIQQDTICRPLTNIPTYFVYPLQCLIIN